MNRFAMLAEQIDLSADSDAPVLLSALLDENTGNRVDNGSPIEQLKETAADSTELILSAEEGKGHKLEKRVDKSTKDDESNTNAGVQEPNRGTAGVNTQVTSLEMLLEMGDVEENIQESFITLPEQEQQWIINRLELLKLNLTKCRAEKRIVPIAPQLESLAEIHNLSPIPQAQLCGTEEVMEIQTTCPEEQVEDQGSNRERELVAKQAHKLNSNGSICPEANISLEKIIELD
ncbi:UNVERIFIED_CONTAM: hypothetical protein K2H54_004633 [Gekko kuhli]